MISHLKGKLKRLPWLYAVIQQILPFGTLFWGLLSGRRGSLQHLFSTWSLISRSAYIAGRPMNISIEPVNICNLRCPVCETGNGQLGRVKEQMSLGEFKTILGKVSKNTNTLMFYFMGEPFLNREAYQMIRAAKDAGIPWVTTCTNGDLVDPQQLVLSGLNEVSFQIGGMSSETHRIYRVNGNFDRVLSKLKETLRLRREDGVKMRIACGFVVMRHNEHEVNLFQKTMDEIGVDEAVIIDPCVRTIEQGQVMLPSDRKHWIYDPAAFEQGILRPQIVPNNSCPWIYYSLVVMVNGDVVACCRDPKGKFVMGNLLKQDLPDIWNGKRFVDFRKRILKDQASVSICKLCSSYPASRVR